MATLLTKLSDLYIKKHIERSYTEECPVCYEYEGDIVYLNCNHFFHGKCIIRWLTTDFHIHHRIPECPVCKTRIKKIILSDTSINYYTSIPKDDMKNEIDTIIDALRKLISKNPQRLVILFFIRSLLLFSLIHGKDPVYDKLMEDSKKFYNTKMPKKQKYLIRKYNEIFEKNKQA
jgi:hypothetical protein